MTVTERARRIKLLIMDCDGVLTDGRLYFSAAGEELKVFHARDGQGIVEWHKAGFRSAIISGRNSPIVEMRGKQLGIEFILQGRKEKISAFNELIAIAGVTADETAFVGDDTPDAEVFPFVGLAVAVGDAHDAVKAAAHHMTKLDGGRGAVREVIDLLIDAKKG
ncbi:MAG TPA: HAD hydrolase family protein [Pyrinomonadaceae bacterium]|nr:HAD hydrolase family protein [Pyrinomonadaceae bacterium]